MTRLNLTDPELLEREAEIKTNGGWLYSNEPTRIWYISDDGDEGDRYECMDCGFTLGNFDVFQHDCIFNSE